MIRTLDLFCGAGGSSCGARAAGATIVGAVDAWGLATATYADNFPNAVVRQSILHRTSNRSVVRGVDKVDLLLASPECTNHTCARGSRDRDEASRATARYVLNFAHAFRPRWIIIENVVQMRGWSRYAELLQKLRADYHVRPQVLDAADFGVPQSRRRLFIVCDAEREPPDLTQVRNPRPPTAATILDPKGSWQAGPLRSRRRAPDTLARAARAIEELGEGVPFLVVYYGTDGGGGWQCLDRPLRTMTTLDRFGLVEWESDGPTLRMLQVPELKRAMGLPAGYRIERGTRRDRIRLLGNGVCPPVLESIVSALTASVSGTIATSEAISLTRVSRSVLPQRISGELECAA